MDDAGIQPGGGGAEDPERILEESPDVAHLLRRLFGEMRDDPDAGGFAPNGLVGHTVGDFRILRQIGSGGMATVFEAVQLSLNRRVALKVLAPHLSLSDTAVRRFQREAEAGGRQAHPGIVSVFAMGEERGVHFIAEEIVEGGGNLAEELERLRGEPDLLRGYFREAARRVAEVAHALADAHATGVIHRDVKPSNILLTEDGHTKVTDFGLARVEDALALSRTGDFAGTPFYMSPEQTMSRPAGVDHRTDVFSLGVTLYESLTLVRPFDGETSQEVLKKILTVEPRDPTRVNPRVPRDLSVICLKAMEKNPEHRYPTMSAFAEDLDRYLAGEPIVARSTGRIRRAEKWVRRHKLASVATGSLVVAVLAMAVLLIVLEGGRRERRRILQEAYGPIREALDDPGYMWYGRPVSWLEDADPDAPELALLRAILAVDSEDLEGAARLLEEGIRSCRERGETYLESDAHYLLGSVNFIRAQDSREPALRRDAESSLRRASATCPPLGEALFDQADEPSRELEGMLESELRGWLRMNRLHFIPQLYHGIFHFETLYKGGLPREFDEAIASLTSVSASRPESVLAWTILGRVYYFFARFHNQLEFITKSQECLNQAIRRSGALPYTMSLMTQGQLSLMRGELDRAGECFEEALRVDEGAEGIQNAMCGLGLVHAQRGDFEAAREEVLEALAKVPGDSHVNVILARLHLALDEPEDALGFATTATIRFSTHRPTSEPSGLAEAHLVAALAQLAQGQRAAALEELKAIGRAVLSPRDFGLGAVLLATFPEDSHDRDLQTTVIQLARAAGWHAESEESTPPIGLSARGASHLVHGEWREAIASFARARRARDRWLDDVRRYHAHEDARDLYIVALAHRRLADETGDDEHARKAEECFAEADALLAGAPAPFEYAPIVARVRATAAEAMGVQ